jgi:very-short-patch-repair endonuclease
MTIIFNRSSEKEKRRILRKTMPKAEVILWFYLKSKKLHRYKFRRQYSIGRYVVDFYCPKVKLAIEIDGPSHFNPSAQQYDFERQEYIESVGIHFIRVTNPDIYENIDGVIQVISDYLNKN